MEIKVAKTAGFCFGVNRAVELTYGLLAEGRRVATLGPLIHNPQAVADMQAKGAFVADSVPQVPDGYQVVIRSHGVPRSVYDELEVRGIAYHDATCPFVQKISALPHRPKKRVPCCWWRAIRPTRRSGHRGAHSRRGVRFCRFGRAEGLEGPLGPAKTPFCSAQTHSGDKMEESSEFLKKPIQTRIF